MRKLKFTPMKISNREKEVLENISFGFTIDEIANRLFLSPHTIISHRKNLFEKLEATNAALLIRRGFQMGLLELAA